MAKITIVYTSTGGNTQLVCEYIAEILQSAGHHIVLQRCEAIENSKTICENNLLILACPTYGQGELQDDFAAFLSRIKSGHWKNHPCTIIGLGDMKYANDYVIESAKLLQDFVVAQQMKWIPPNLCLHQAVIDQLENRAKPWTEKLLGKIEAL